MSEHKATDSPSVKYIIPEVKLDRIRLCEMDNPILDNPEAVARAWFEAIRPADWFDGDVETLAVLVVNTRRRLKCVARVATGTLDTLLVHAREVFKIAIVQNASAIVLAHNHPSGDSSPSEADIKITRDLIRAGQLLKIDLLDHVIIGARHDGDSKGYTSLRELGYFYSS